MDHSNQGELFSNLCDTHKGEYHGRKHMVLADICTCGRVRYYRPESVEANKLSVGTIWFVDGIIHTRRDSGTPCFWEPD